MYAIDDGCKRNVRDTSVLAPPLDAAAYFLAWHAISGVGDNDLCVLTVDRVTNRDDPYVLIGGRLGRADPADPLGLDSKGHFWSYAWADNRYVELNEPGDAPDGQLEQIVKDETSLQLSLIKCCELTLKASDGTMWQSRYHQVVHLDHNGRVLADVLIEEPACPRTITNPTAGYPRLVQLTRDRSLWFTSWVSTPTGDITRLWKLTADLKLKFLDLPKDSQFKAVSGQIYDFIWIKGTKDNKPVIYRFTASDADSTINRSR